MRRSSFTEDQMIVMLREVRQPVSHVSRRPKTFVPQPPPLEQMGFESAVCRSVAPSLIRLLAAALHRLVQAALAEVAAVLRTGAGVLQIGLAGGGQRAGGRSVATG